MGVTGSECSSPESLLCLFTELLSRAGLPCLRGNEVVRRTAQVDRQYALSPHEIVEVKNIWKQRAKYQTPDDEDACFAVVASVC